ncbi:thioesterase II family protein [Pseudoalteromonas rubra]|uniref:Putative thioesterase n=1 Tax=Pseudoalteromonas rubra TaxID=43658 RepID=A0A4Q7ENP1_9GAMM|nr:thioesterase domain-containing protein [Pseudoalteromonas rubra]RZM85202.1 putative thioesterase [Pseudoalteromonas rubra]
MVKDNVWFVQHKPKSAHITHNLFCFPYAGGSGQVYLDWPQKVPDHCQVIGIEYPGRGRRFGEPLENNLTQLVEALFDSIKPSLTKPFSFYGHSNGALVAFELAKKINAELGLKPKKLFIAAKRAPQNGREFPLHALPEDEFISVLKQYKGTPEQVFNTPELLELYTPILRADFALSETYEFTAAEQLNMDTVVIAGAQDEVASSDEVFAWGELFCGNVSHETLPGGHFFLHECAPQLLNIINREL